MLKRTDKSIEEGVVCRRAANNMALDGQVISQGVTLDSTAAPGSSAQSNDCVCMANKNIQVTTTDDFDVPISMDEIILNEHFLNAWTGIPTFRLFEAIVRCVERIKGEDNCVASLKDRVMMVFVKLKTNLSFICMASVFRVSESSITRYFESTLPIIEAAVRTAIYFPTSDEVRRNLPKCFKPDFANVRAILDCTEVQIQKPKCDNCNTSTYSQYTGANTVKFLVCITPGGLISFVSEGYTGKSSEELICTEEKLLEKFDRNIDAIMVDKGFDIADETDKYGIKLVRPTFAKGPNFKFEESKADDNTKVSIARVHIERTIKRIQLFAILRDKIELNLVSHINRIFHVIAAVTNLTEPADDTF